MNSGGYASVFARRSLDDIRDTHGEAEPHRTVRRQSRTGACPFCATPSGIKSTQMLIIDGSQGEGGGQIIRSSLALSLVTGKPFRAVHVRANRDKPGLRQQHLTAVNAAAKVGRGNVTGAAVGATEFTFFP